MGDLSICSTALVVCIFVVASSAARINRGNDVLVWPDKLQERRWIFSASGNKRPYNYLDTDGYLKGFDIDLINAVCKQAEKICEVQVRDFTECGTTDENGDYVPGEGLINHEIDGCVSRAITDSRLKYFSFTAPYTTSFGHFFVRPGNPRDFDETNVSGKVISLLTGIYTNDECLQKYNRTGATYIVGDRIYEAVDFVITGQADALFAPRTQIPELERLEGNYECTEGTGIMALKDSQLPDWWDPAFNKVKQTGKFKEICDNCKGRHGRAVSCIL